MTPHAQVEYFHNFLDFLKKPGIEWSGEAITLESIQYRLQDPTLFVEFGNPICTVFKRMKTPTQAQKEVKAYVLSYVP